MNNEQKVIAMLERIVAGDLTGIREDKSLSYHVVATSRRRGLNIWEVMIRLQEYTSSWEHYSGCRWDPIRLPWYYREKTNNMYQGRQLLMRQSLAKHLIKCIKGNR